MEQVDFLIITAGMFAATFSVRFVPMAFFNRVDAPSMLQHWLGYIPTTIFSALIVHSFMRSGDQIDMTHNLPLLFACTVTLVSTLKTKSLVWGMGIGYAAYVGLTLL